MPRAWPREQRGGPSPLLLCLLFLLSSVVGQVVVPPPTPQSRAFIFFPTGSGPDKTAIALASAFSSLPLLPLTSPPPPFNTTTMGISARSSDLTVVRFPMPPTLADYTPWIENSGGSPDVLPWYPRAGGNTVFTSEHYIPIPDVHASSGLDSDLPLAAKKACTGTDGAILGVPMTTQVFWCLHRNSTLTHLNLSPPTTWSGLLQFCQAVLDAGFPSCLGTDFDYFPTSIFLDYLLIRMHGNAFYLEFFDGKIPFTDPRILDSLRVHRTLYDRGFLVPSPSGDGKLLPQSSGLADNSIAVFCGVDAAVGPAVKKGVPPSDLRGFPFPPVFDREGATLPPGEPNDLVISVLPILAIPQNAVHPDKGKEFLTFVADVNTCANVTIPSLSSGFTNRLSLAPRLQSQRSRAAFDLFSSLTTAVTQPSRSAFVHAPIAETWNELVLNPLNTQPNTSAVLTAFETNALVRVEAVRFQYALGKTSFVVPSLPSSSYTGTVVLELSCLTPDASIYFTLDGSPVTKFSTLYESPLVLQPGVTHVVRTMSQAPLLQPSDESVLTYAVTILPVSSSASSSDDDGSSTLLLATLIPILAIILCVAVAVGYLFHRRSVARNTLKIGATNKNLIIDGDMLEMGEPVGQGAFGVVYKGQWRMQTVAVKRMFQNMLTRKQLRSFCDEAEMLLRLRHANIVMFHGIMLTPPSIVTEFMDRGSLFDVLHDEIILIHSSMVFAWADQITRGLQFLEQSGVVHGDMKSVNVLLDRHWVAKLSDFGMSVLDSTTAASVGNHQHDNQHRGSTVTPMVTPEEEWGARPELSSAMGTLFWSAPEILQGTSPVTAASDAYALGITLWEMATRSFVFAGENPMSVAVDVLNGKRPPGDAVPTQFVLLRQIMQGLWVQDPTQRMTFASVLSALEPSISPGPPVYPSQSIRGNGTYFVVRFWLPDGMETMMRDPDVGEPLLASFHEYCREIQDSRNMSLMSCSIEEVTLAFENDRQMEQFIAGTSESVAASKELLSRVVCGVARGVLVLDPENEGGLSGDAVDTLDAFIASHPGSLPGIFVHASARYALEPLLMDQTGSFSVEENVDDTFVRFVRPVELAHPVLDGESLSTVFGTRGVTLMSPDQVRTMMATAAGNSATDVRMGSFAHAYTLPDSGVVLKVLLQQKMSCSQTIHFAAQVVRTAQASRAHDSLSGPISLCVTRPYVSFTIPHAPDGSLQDYLGTRLASSGLNIQKILINLSRAVTLLHSTTNAPHGALRPTNVLVTRSDLSVSLIDFGLEAIKTNFGTLTMTPTIGYSAPEELRGSHPTMAADVYAFGSILFEAIVGQPAFVGRNAMEVCFHILHANTPSLDTLEPAIQDLIRTCWNPSPDARPSMDKVSFLLFNIPDHAFFT